MSAHHDDHDEIEDHDLGLSHDLPKIVERNRLGRRGLLGLLGGVGVIAVAGCSTSSTDTASSTATDTASSAAGAPSGAPSGGPGGALPSGGPGGGGPGGGGGDTADVDVADGEIPEETAGPFPGDGSNGPNVLTESGIVRSDMTASFGTASGVAAGVPTTVRLKVYDLNGTEATPLEGAAVYLWHCDAEGRYSMYDDDVSDENYLRGVQSAAADGTLEFATIFPGAYMGRYPHMHFEVYRSLEDATTYTNKLRTSQLALPGDACEAVYATDGYEQSATNYPQTPLTGDGIFSDGYSLQLAAGTGSVDDGYVISLNIPV